MSCLEIEGLSHSFGDHVIFQNARLALEKGEHAGVVGENGVGKSTLIKICTGQLIPDQGRVSWQPGLSRGYLDQYAQTDRGLTLGAFLRSAFQDLYRREEECQRLYQLAAEGDREALVQAALLQEELESRDFYTVDARIAQVAQGLGLSALGLDRPLEKMSGGQRARAILGKLLLEKPDVLLLDEPTNFLDKEHVAWLGEYLSGLDNAFLVVTHDFRFLETIADRIFDLSGGKIAKYSGSFSQFLQKREAHREEALRRYTAQQREIRKTEEFIRRNIAGQRTKMAQGRRKRLERLERLEAPGQSSFRPSFHFSALPAAESRSLVLRGLSVGYGFPLLPGLSLSVRGGERVVVTGFNGIGKTTLLKTLAGELPPLGGSFAFSPQARVGYLPQDFSWEDSALTPLEVLSREYPSLSQKEARQILARCGVSRLHAQQAVGTLSGGEQAKVKLCLLTRRPCSFLLLDEPTSHLDQAAKEALQQALGEFPGTVLLVSHEEDFYRDWAQRVISLEQR